MQPFSRPAPDHDACSCLLSRSTTRSHGAPQAAQQPFADVPARMQGSTSFVGIVAKWVPAKLSGPNVQTDLRFRVGESVCKEVLPMPFVLPFDLSNLLASCTPIVPGSCPVDGSAIASAS